MKIGLAQIDCEVGNLEYNCGKFAEYASRAKDSGCEVVIFPEMSDTGYLPSAISEHALPWPGLSYNAASSAAASYSIAVICGISERVGSSIYNTAAFFAPSGELLGKYRKSHLFSAAPVHEDRICAAGNEFKVISFGGFNWGLSICYDLRFPELYRVLTLRGSNVLINCTAWPESRATHWDTLTRARAIENQAFFVGVDRVGTDGELVMHGHSRVVTPRGEILCQASGDSEELLVAELDSALIEEFRQAIPAIASRRADLYAELVSK